MEIVRIFDDILLKIVEYIWSDTNYPFPYRTGRELSLDFQIIKVRTPPSFLGWVIRGREIIFK